MSLCVNTHSKEFKDTAKRLDIDEASLENILHEYMNSEGNAEAFPSDSYILSKIEGIPFDSLSEKEQKLIELKYSKPFILDSYEDAQAVMNDMAQYFDPIHIGLKKTHSGKYEVTLNSKIDRDNIYYQTKKSESEIIDDANTRRTQEIMELESNVKDLQTRLSSLKTNKNKFINSEMSKINDAVNSARKDIQSKGKVSIDRLNTIVDRFNEKYNDLIQAGILNKLDASSIAPKISTFNEEGRAIYDTSKILVRREMASIGKEVSRRYRNELGRISNSLKDAQEKFQQAERSSLAGFINDSYYQINKPSEEISAVVDKIKPINKKLGSLGSISKIEDLLKKADAPVEIRSAILEGYKTMPSTLKGMTPYEALQYVASAQYKGLVAQYNESIRKPVNEKLEGILTDYLKKYNFEINIGDAVKKFGDVTGVLDIINKIIYVANNRNETTLPEEFGHAFVELLGSTTSRREENKEFTFLMNTVENTELYKTVFENYKDVYKREDGTPDTYKIKKEAIGQGIGLALLSQYQGGHEETKTFLQRLKDFVERILNKFRGTEYLSFENMVNQMAKEVLDGSTKRLDKVDKTGYNLLDYYKTIEEQNKKDGGKALEFMQYFTSIGNEITGSLAYRLQGAVYRPGLDSLHDIDMHVPPSAHGIDFSNPIVQGAILTARARNQEELFNVITTNPYFSKIKEKYPKLKFGAAYPDSKGKDRVTVNAIYSEDTSLSDRFLKMSGSYAERLSNFTEEERGQIYLFDFFLGNEESAGFFEPTYGLQLSSFDVPLREKRWMGRAKDIMDYQNWRVFDDYKNKVLPTEEDLMYQISPINPADQKYITVDSRQMKLFDEFGNVTKEAYSTNGLSAPKPDPVRPELQKFQEKAARRVEQLNTLLDSDLMSNTEVRHVAEQAVYFISDSITEFLEDPAKIFIAFPELAVKNGTPMTEEEKNSEIEKVKEMSRVELARYISPERLIEFTKVRLFTPQGNPNINTRDLIKKSRLIRDNFDAVIKFAGDAFTIVEDFAITTEGERITITEDLSPLDETFDKANDADYVLENEGNLQEHWQIESRTLDILSSMSQLVKRALNKCFQVQINPETGIEEHVPSEFGIAERVNAKDATSSILRWTRGAESLSHMLQLMEQKVSENPWVKQIVDRLKDTSGNEADFQSQFYGVFAKAFQPYSIILKEKNAQTGQFEYKSIQVNQSPALTEATQSIEVAFKTNTHPLFDNGSIRKDVLETFTEITNSLIDKAQHSLEENNRTELINLLEKASAALGYTIDPSVINLALDSTKTFHKMVNNLKSISDNLNKALGQENYDPFKFRGENSISGYLKKFLTPLTERLEETAVSSFYDSGKMYQSYVTPSYLTVLMNHFTSEDSRFQNFLESEYGAYEWFRNADGTWKNLWLGQLDGMSQEDRKNLFKHKVQLNFNKHNYMRNMSDVEYALSILSEYFSEFGGTSGNTVPVWFRIPMMSNKPSSEFIRMNAYTGKTMEYMLTDGFNRIFQQELGRIQTVEVRDYDKKNPNFIKNFDKNGKKFVMLDFFNKYLKGGKEANSDLGRLINKAIEQGTSKLSVEEQAKLNELVNSEIVSNMDTKADAIIAEWKTNGIFEGAKQVANIGTEDSVVEQRLREFIWNDTFASMNILELTITDPAFYKDAEDLQKRLAQIHAPGIRANVEAIDYQGNKVTDGLFRTVLLTDFDDFISNIKDNLRIVFDKKLKELENSGISKEDARYKATAATYDNVISQFDNINVADAQGYSSPTSYRKKAFIFGKWSKSAEEIYNKLREGKYNYSDLNTAFQPLKPFVYGQIGKPGIDADRSNVPVPMTNLKVPVQFKNSEYLLIMADAILQGEDTGKPNLLRAIYEVMEESATNNPTRGIDTVQFESTCKSGLMAPINIKQFYNVQGGETLAKLALERAIYNTDGSYNTGTYVYEVPFENYAIQQEVPEHFKNHYQAHGSQIRYIIPSDLESIDSEGNPVTYDYFDRGEQRKLSADEFRNEYEHTVSENIEASIDELSRQLGIGNYYISKKDRNIALSEILINEIYSSPRYGADLIPACTVNSETGEFNIPLGDPIQSKRIEQLINSIVKNRINKQEIAGGPVVQVTNFGTSRELNIRFKSKDGSLLMTKDEFAKTAPQNGKSYNVDAAYRKYIEENQAGIAYYEVFAPIFANELFEKFADENGNIDIETIEAINPDLLKMIGYRIPTEDKYSMAPLKIVGFLPREAGDGIMLPNDITLLTGSDFDVDKFYLMRKEIGIAMRQAQQGSVTVDNFDTAAKEFTKNHKQQIRNHLKEVASNLLFNETKLTEEEETSVKERISNRADFAIEQENKRHQAALEQIEEDATDALIAYDERVEAGETIEGQEERAETKVEKAKQRQIDRENRYHDRQVAKYEARREIDTDNALTKAQDRKINNIVNDFLEGDIFAKSSDRITKVLKDAYVRYMFDYVEDTEGTTYRNNKIVDMSWAVLTNETTASKMLTPGGFEPEKRMGYLISAYQNPANNLSWEQLNSITDVDELKSLCYTDKNLCFIDTHLQFYKQNSAAATALGMAAVQKVAHAVFESNGFRIDVENALNFDEGEFFSIAGKEFSGMMEIDKKYNDEGDLIGRTLGEFVAMFADAVKDPVANLMNINSTTMPIVTTLIRFGMPFNDAALFISQPAIRRVLELYNSENVTNFVRLSEVIERQLRDIEKYYDISQSSTLKKLNNLTKEELIENLGKNRDAVIDYKVLKFFQYMDTLSKTLKSPTYATRFNSISNAVGPLVIDNLIMEYKATEGNFENFYDADGYNADINTIMNAHPILGSFYKALDISKKLLDDMPTNSDNFKNMLDYADSDVKSAIFGDKKTLSELSDFYQSYLLVASGAIPTEATKENPHQGLKYYLEKFPKDFMKAKAKELFKGNALIDAIKLDIQKGREVLIVDTTGLTTQDKERLGDGWADLYKSGERGRKLAEHLFYYNFWRTGIGFSPKSFMALFPTRLKDKIRGYNEAFIVHSDRFAANVDGSVVLDQYVRNNADNNKIAPRIKIGDGGVKYTREGEGYVFSGENYEAVKNKYYIKVKSGNRDILLRKDSDNNIKRVATYTELSLLGNNGEYFEASLRADYTPIASTTETKQQNNEGQMEEIGNNQIQVDDVPVENKSTFEQQSKRAEKIKDMLLKMFKMTGRTEEQAQAKLDEFKNKSAEEKKSLRSPMKKFIADKFDKLGIKYDEKLLEEMYEELC